MENLMWLIVGMSIVTLLPRLVPIWIVDRFSPPPWVKEWLSYIPYAALGALTFPGVLTVVKDAPWIGLLGGIVAVGIACLRLSTLYVITGALLTVVFIKWMM
ncbi:AzlD domain-containing protein [Mechercharimyces sp. CAU 1602]|uniref:AzlD domain-containing protein n=1 Tax=Mechercharimyces sp. CAU 1602 TaxID=2973933 RepID=UPI002162B279|nr:AzlD domain-containing protein [Mechercharimyces sp. CAU 1602]MCS1350395.1 AzlD domain-containing protein [Mechercharimyces sp. CAU 1602]